MNNNRVIYLAFTIIVLFNAILVLYFKQNHSVNKTFIICNKTLPIEKKYSCGTIDCIPSNIDNGYCFLGEWFCKAGWNGTLCDIPIDKKECLSGTLVLLIA